jgi:hypothetical protein
MNTTLNKSGLHFEGSGYFPEPSLEISRRCGKSGRSCQPCCRARHLERIARPAHFRSTSRWVSRTTAEHPRKHGTEQEYSPVHQRKRLSSQERTSDCESAVRAKTLKQVGRYTCFARMFARRNLLGPPAIMGVIRHGDFQVETRRVGRSTRIASAIRRVDKESMQTFAFLTRLRSCGLDGILQEGRPRRSSCARPAAHRGTRLPSARGV